METVQLKKKICLLGQFGVGKTSLAERYVNNRFDDKYLTTIGVKVSQKTLPPLAVDKNKTRVQYDFLIWDIAGMEKFDSMIVNYYSGAAGALVIGDLTRLETVSGLPEICQKFLSFSPSAKLFFVGNKIDLLQDIKAERKKVQEVANQFKTEYLFTSAKTGELVEEAFLALAKRLE